MHFHDTEEIVGLSCKKEIIESKNLLGEFPCCLETGTTFAGLYMEERLRKKFGMLLFFYSSSCSFSLTQTAF